MPSKKPLSAFILISRSTMLKINEMQFGIHIAKSIFFVLGPIFAPLFDDFMSLGMGMPFVDVSFLHKRQRAPASTMIMTASAKKDIGILLESARLTCPNV